MNGWPEKEKINMKSYENQQIRRTVSNQKSKKHSVAFFERGSWYHRTETVDEKGNIKYGKIGGFATQNEAEEDYWRCNDEFEKRLLLSNDEPQSRSLSDYLVRWFENDFSSRIQNTTRMVTAYMIYDIILPNIKNDVKLSLVLMKDEILLKAISSSLGHAKTIISVDVYGDMKKIIEDSSSYMDSFIAEILPDEAFSEKPIINVFTDIYSFLSTTLLKRMLGEKLYGFLLVK